jgi:hypothetical protein
MPFSDRQQRFSYLIVIGLLFAFFYEVIFLSKNFIFRDGAHFYYPLFLRIQEQWSSGTIPTWNALENSGQPLAANATSSVFYPGKLLFFLPSSFGFNFQLYIVGHVILAWTGMYRLCRSQNISRPGSQIAALAYAFCGNVLFQFCNIVFLCGAAWIPWSFLFGLKLFQKSTWKDSLLLAFSLSMMTLSGDPEATYLFMMSFGVGLLLKWYRSKKYAESSSASSQENPSGIPDIFRKCTLGLLLAAGLSAIQLLPTYELTGQSTRNLISSPRNVYDLVLESDSESEENAIDLYSGLLGKPGADDPHGQSIYQFSLAPWRIAEFIWPNFFGKLYPNHQRWEKAIPAASAVWVPTNYLGLMPFVLAISAFQLRKKQTELPFETQWLSYIAVIFFCGSLGGYGLGWLFLELETAFTGESHEHAFGASIGGVYWFFNVFLPGFSAFRFPAKLMIVFSCATCFLCGIGWDQAINSHFQRAKKYLIGILAFSFIGIIAALTMKPFWNEWMQGQQDNYFGPLDASGAYGCLLDSVVYGAILSALFLLAIVFFQKKRASKTLTSAFPVLILLVSAFDIWFATHWTLQSADREIWHTESNVAKAITAHRETNHLHHPFRAFRERTIGMSKSTRSQPHFKSYQLEGLKLDRNSVSPKYHLIDELAFVQTQGTFQQKNYTDLFKPLVQSTPDGEKTSIPAYRMLNAWNTEYFILEDTQGGNRRESEFPNREDFQEISTDHKIPGVKIYFNKNAIHRAWIVHSVEVRKPMRRTSDIQAWINNVSFSQQDPFDLSNKALVETNLWPEEERNYDTPETNQNESISIAAYNDKKVILNATLNRAGLIVLSDNYYPGWKAEIENIGEVPIVRTNRSMRGIFIEEPGSYRITFRYEPASIKYGLVISLVSFLIFSICLFVSWKKHRHLPQNDA